MDEWLALFLRSCTVKNILKSYLENFELGLYSVNIYLKIISSLFKLQDLLSISSAKVA